MVETNGGEKTDRPAGPRKIVVGTTIFSIFPQQRPYVSLDHRLEEIGRRLDDMAVAARTNHGKGLDIAVFPENSLNPPRDGREMAARAVPLDAKVRGELGAMARRHQTYLVVCFNLLEEGDAGTVSNAAVLFDRQGAVAGIYRKVFGVADLERRTVEGGKKPGDGFPVFQTDFGRIGLLICYDMGFVEGLEAYAAEGVDLILWPSMSPQTVVPRLNARRFGLHIVSATPRSNASVFDPLGEIVAQATREGVVTCEIDLDFRIVHWQAALRNGEALRERYGDKVGFRYSETEDYGIFWSNDPGLPIGKMLDESGIITDDAHRDRSREVRAEVLGEQACFRSDP
ncbi:MAG: carbon-nitrogen hydrolase family protein [Terrimicrobiaceae bacterium]